MRVHIYESFLDDNNDVYLKEGCHIVRELESCTCKEDVVKMLNSLFGLGYRDTEYIYVLGFTTGNNKLKGVCELSHGFKSGAALCIRELFQKLLLMDADGFMFIHNHPCGTLVPSRADLSVARTVKEAGELMCIKLMDCIIIHKEQCLSFMDSL